MSQKCIVNSFNARSRIGESAYGLHCTIVLQGVLAGMVKSCWFQRYSEIKRHREVIALDAVSHLKGFNLVYQCRGAYDVVDHATSSPGDERELPKLVTW